MCIIETMELLENPMDHDHVSRILSREHTALAAIGSPACIRTLWFRAKRLGALNRFYGKVLSEIDYALGRQIDEVEQIIREIRRDPSIRHIVVYASCLELVTMCDLERECRKFEGICVRERSAGGAFISPECGMEQKVSLHVFYRGPLVKRSGSAKQALDEILADMENCEATAYEKAATADSKCSLCEMEQHQKEAGNAAGDENQQIPPFPDFAKKIFEHAWEDCDILLLTPGGCKSCIEETALAQLSDLDASADQKCPEQIRANFYNTRMDDVTISQGCSELYQVILETFPGKRPLYLVGSAVLHMIGFDGEVLAKRLTLAGRETVWLGGEGF